MSSLAEWVTRLENLFMQRPRMERARALPLRPQDEVECRHCDVHCDKVVYPSSCVDRACPFLYAYEDHGHTFIGCMQKVFEVEIDLDLLRMAEESSAGFGAVKAMRRALPMCHVAVESTYESRVEALGCQNPEFFELPVGEPTFKIFAQVKPSA